MPRDGSGNFARSVTPPVNGDVASATDFNSEMNDIATALSDSLNKSGTKAAAANLPMGGFKLTGLGAGSSNGDSVRYEQLTAVSAAAQPLDATLTALAALSHTSGTLYISMTAADTFALTSTILVGNGSTSAPSLGPAADANTGFYFDGADAINVTNGGTTTWAWSSTGNLSGQAATNRIRPGAGSVSLPGMSFSTDTDNGFYLIGADNWGAAVGGVKVLDFSSSGLADVSGNIWQVGGKQAVPVPASGMVSRTTSGAASGSTETTTNKIMVRSLDFDAAADEFAQFTIPAMPKRWNESTITFKAIWTATNTGNVVWGMQAVAISDDDVLDAAFGTAVTVTDGVTAANDVMKSAESSAITIGGTPAEGDMVVFQVYRDADDASDTCTVDAKLIGVELFFSFNGANDA